MAGPGASGRSFGTTLGSPVVRLIALATIVGTTTVAITAGAVPADAATCAPQQVTAAADSHLDDLFQAYGNSGTGTTWTGGDGSESVLLPDGRELWLFDDTFLGKVVNGQRNRRKSPYLHNSLVVESQGALTTTLYTQRGRHDSAYVNPRPPRNYKFGLWPGGTVVNGNQLQSMMVEIQFKPGVFTFKELRDYLVTFALPSLAVVSVYPLVASGIDWSQGVLSDNGYTYVYGTAGGSAYAARVPGTDLSAPWSYYDGNGGWTSNPAHAGPIAGGVETAHMSVSRVATGSGTTYALVTMPSLADHHVVAAFGCSPTGPFGPEQDVYTTPEPASYPSSYDVITYGAHAHPELDPSPNTLVVSYDVNPVGPQGLSVPDASIYRPRFIDIALH